MHERADRFANDEGFFELYITLLKRKITDVIISFAKGVMPQNYVEEEEAVNQKLLSLFHQKEGLMKYDALLEVLELSRKAELDRRTTTFSLFSALSHIKGQ